VEKLFNNIGPKLCDASGKVKYMPVLNSPWYWKSYRKSCVFSFGMIPGNCAWDKKGLIVVNCFVCRYEIITGET